MPRTIVIDSVEVTRMQLLRDGPAVRIYVEYSLKAGEQVIDTRHRDFTLQLAGTRRSQALAAFEAIAQDIAAIELP